MIQAGKLRHKVTIQTPTETQDEYGQPVQTWATFAEVFASVEPIRGREFFAAQQIQSDVTTRIRIRYLSGVTTKMRVVHTTDHSSPATVEEYDIEAVIHVEEKRREMHLMCRKRDADGFRA